MSKNASTSELGIDTEMIFRVFVPADSKAHKHCFKHEDELWRIMADSQTDFIIALDFETGKFVAMHNACWEKFWHSRGTDD